MIEPLIYKATKAEQKLDENFTVNDNTYLVRCPKCKRENYAMSVSSGVCAWCGYDANKKEVDNGPEVYNRKPDIEWIEDFILRAYKEDLDE